ncbi:hypothetical protein B0I18_102445 [Taibaiella chishuiensis]|uniref:Uncharacterized protein n=1 Tax=Taibaiella chishuiensis TaxID=1434707 RepID=A0A2P8D8B8_9BACT|nr:hypothetical protein B0I18_102445 [Taibaiella chishuiensis]
MRLFFKKDGYEKARAAGPGLLFIEVFISFNKRNSNPWPVVHPHTLDS